MKKAEVDYERLAAGDPGAATIAVDGRAPVPWGAALVGLMFPQFAIAKAVAGAVRDFFGPNDSVAAEDVKNVNEIIAKARESGVDEMDITLSRKRAAGLKGKLDGDAEVALGLESDAHARIRVKFK